MANEQRGENNNNKKCAEGKTPSAMSNIDVTLNVSLARNVNSMYVLAASIACVVPAEYV